jgi:hypothetical protein
MENSRTIGNKNKDVDIISTDDRTIKEKNTIKDVLGPEWRDYFCKEDTIGSLLQKLEIMDQEYAGIEDIYAINDDRLSLTVWTRDKNNLEQNTMIIDVLMKEMSSQQMIDVTYNIGEGCSPKIVIYEQVSDRLECKYTRLREVAQLNTQCGFPTYLVAMKPSAEGVTFILELKPVFDEDMGFRELPSKAEFLNIEPMRSKDYMKAKLAAIVKRFTIKETALEFLNTNRIVRAEAINSVERYEKGEDRKGVLLYVQEAITEKLTKILIDVRYGQPCIDQVYDAIYEIGKDCSKRIILSTGDVRVDYYRNPAADEMVVWNLIRSMNKYRVGLYLAKIGLNATVDDPLDLSLLERPRNYPDRSIADLPSIQQFREGEFWNVYFDSRDGHFYESWHPFQSGIEKSSSYRCWQDDDNLLEAYADWNEEGAMFSITEVTDDTAWLKRIWTSKRAELKKCLPDAEISFTDNPGRPRRIDVKFSDLPVTSLLHASPEEKASWAEELAYGFRPFVHFIEKAMWEMKYGTQECTTENVLPEISGEQGGIKS